MIITMRKRRYGIEAGPTSLPFQVALLVLLSSDCRANLKFTPAVEIRESYTDNVNLASDAAAQSQFVSEIIPGFTLSDIGPRLKLRAAYQMHYYGYAGNAIVGAQRSQNALQADAQAKLIEELLFLDANASISQQSISAFGPQVNQNDFASANRAEVKTVRIAPYLRHSFGSTASTELRYVHDSVDSGNTGLGHSRGDAISFNLASGAAFRNLGWGVQFARQQLHDSIAPATSSQTVSANLRYRVAPTFSLTVKGGYDKNDYQALNGSSSGKFYLAGFVWTPTPRTSLQASAGRRFYGPTYGLLATHRSRSSVWSLNYNEALTTTSAQFTLPATIDTSELLDRLFTANIADPLARQQAVAAYISANRLPGSLADSINYFSNRQFLQKQFQASAAFNSARTTLILSVFDTRRTALSVLQTDSSLLGIGNATLNDDTRQVGVNGLLNWRLSPRTGVNFGVSASRIESRSSGLSGDNKTLRLSMTHQFKPKLKGAFELRRAQGSDQNGSRYRENAVSATLSMQL